MNKILTIKLELMPLEQEIILEALREYIDLRQERMQFCEGYNAIDLKNKIERTIAKEEIGLDINIKDQFG